MESEHTKVYGANRQTRCMKAIKSGEDESRFILGTLGLNQPNEVHLLTISDIENENIQSRVFNHTEEIWDIEENRWTERGFFTVHSKEKEGKYQKVVAMYEYPHKETPNYAAEGEGFDRDVMEYGMQNEGKAGKSKEDLIKLCEISDKDVCGNITKVVCNRGTVGDKEIIVIGYNGASLLKYSERGLEHVQDFGEIRKKHSKVVPGIEDRISDGNFDDTGNIIMLSRRDLIFGIDKRTNKVEYSIQVGNRDGKLVFSSSTVNSGQIMVGGRNGDILVYDIRKTSVNCLTKVGGAHSHWVNGLESNSNFEQLLISGGSDGLVNLYNIESVSKGVTLDEEEEEEPADFGRIREDRIVKQYETHDAGVYSVHWSLSNPWMFASLSIDGRFIVNSVPQYEKNKILSI